MYKVYREESASPNDQHMQEDGIAPHTLLSSVTICSQLAKGGLIVHIMAESSVLVEQTIAFLPWSGYKHFCDTLLILSHWRSGKQHHVEQLT